jgi:hypothetical protein
MVYRDDELDVDQLPPSGPPEPAAVKLPRPARGLETAGPGDLEGTRRYLRAQALARRYRLGAVRWTDGERGGRYVRSQRGGVMRLNATAALVMDACTDGTPATAVARMTARSGAAGKTELERDVLVSVRRLASRGVLQPAIAHEERRATRA